MADWPLVGDGQVYLSHGEVRTATRGVASSSPGTGYGVWTPLPLRNQAGTTILSQVTTIQAAGFTYTAHVPLSQGAYAVDIGIGASDPPIKTIVQRVPINSTGDLEMGGYSVNIPIGLPLGTRLWARLHSDGGVLVALEQMITVYGTGWRAPSPLSVCTTYNMQGTVLDGEATGNPAVAAINYCDPGTTGGVWSTPWTNISSIASPSTATLVRPCSMALFALMPRVTTAFPPTSSTTHRWYVDIGILDGVTVYPLFENILIVRNAVSDIFYQPLLGPVPLSLPAGTTVVARAIIDSNEDTIDYRSIGVAMYAIA